MTTIALKSHLDRLLASREHPKTICPSEVARALSSSEVESAGATEWRYLMPTVREILWDMRQRGEVELLQRGEIISNDIPLEDIKGPIRARRVRKALPESA